MYIRTKGPQERGAVALHSDLSFLLVVSFSHRALLASCCCRSATVLYSIIFILTNQCPAVTENDAGQERSMLAALKTSLTHVIYIRASIQYKKCLGVHTSWGQARTRRPQTFHCQQLLQPYTGAHSTGNGHAYFYNKSGPRLLSNIKHHYSLIHDWTSPPFFLIFLNASFFKEGCDRQNSCVVERRSRRFS